MCQFTRDSTGFVPKPLYLNLCAKTNDTKSRGAAATPGKSTCAQWQPDRAYRSVPGTLPDLLRRAHPNACLEVCSRAHKWFSSGRGFNPAEKTAEIVVSRTTAAVGNLS